MDNFRKPKSPQKPKTNVDGFFSSSSSGNRSQQPSSVQFKTQTPAGGHIGNFKSSDGFKPVEQGRITMPSARQTGRQPARDANGGIRLSMPAESSKQKTNKKRRGTKGWSRVAMKTFIGIIITGVLVGGYLFGKGYLKARQIFKGGTAGAAALQENVDPTKLNGEGDGRVNVLLLGKGGEGHTAPDLTDTILVASIDPIQKEAALLSIPRDLYVGADSDNTKINGVYAAAKGSALYKGESNDKAEEAGVKAIQEEVEDTMGIPVHYYVMIDFDGFKKAIDTVGGVDINVTSKTALYEQMMLDGGPYTLNVQPGLQHLDGFKALAYARSRMTSSRGDFDRAERQRLVLLAMKDKIISAGTFGNPVKISQLISDFGNNMRSNLSTGEVLRLYEIGKSIDGSKVASVGLADPPNNFVTTDMIGGQSVVVPRAGTTDYSEIKNFVRNALKDGYLRNENGTIAVYNGTTIGGLAGSKATDLRSYGYNVNVVADAPTKTYAKTVLIDLRNGEKKYTKNYLEKRLGVTAITAMPDATIDPGTADFVIILGANESAY